MLDILICIFFLNIKTTIAPSNVLYKLYLVIHLKNCGATQLVSKVSVCFPSGIYIGTDRPA